MKNEKIKTLFTFTFIFLNMGALAEQKPVNLNWDRTLGVVPEEQQSDQVPDNKLIITGKVIDSNGDPIIGATIKEPNSNNGTVTDLDGKFSLSITANRSFLILSYEQKTSL